MLKIIKSIGISFLFCSPVMAGSGTVVEILNNNEITTAITDGQKVRMNLSDSEYIVIDYSNHSVKVVNPAKQTVTLLNADELSANGEAVKVQTSLTPHGQGQSVAGFETQKFSYQANGSYCGVIYGSHNAYQQSGVRQLVAALKTMMDRQRAALGSFARLVDACTLADMQLINHVNTLGVPMRTEKAGSIELEVREISTDVVLANDVFDIPASYKAVNMHGQTINAGQPAREKLSARQPVQQSIPQQYLPAQNQSRRQAYRPAPGYPPSRSYRYRDPGIAGYYPQPRY